MLKKKVKIRFRTNYSTKFKVNQPFDKNRNFETFVRLIKPLCCLPAIQMFFVNRQSPLLEDNGQNIA